MTSAGEDGVVCWLHLGDQHLDAPDAQHVADLRALVAEAAQRLRAVDFAFLPGDVAEHGAASEYALAREALAGIRLPLFAIPGDHDMHPKTLDNFRAAFPRALPHREIFAGRRCLFLDFVSHGAGGPDFRLGGAQLDWLARELAAADAANGAVLFMHAYPADLADPEERETLVALIRNHRVWAVDMGHTHYNEIANDGAAIFAATRSTGQIEEGPVGFSLMAVASGGEVSWRFKPLAQSWPLTLIVSPSDRRLVAEAERRPRPPAPSSHFEVAALAFPAERVASCRVRLDDEDWRPMARVSARLWRAEAQAPNRPFRLTVEAQDRDGATDRDVVEVLPQGCGGPPARAGDGSDADAVGAWPQRHIHGGQLGPNRNGRKW